MASREGGHQYKEEFRIGMTSELGRHKKREDIGMGGHTHREKTSLVRTLV